MREVEAKFYIEDKAAFEKKVLDLAAECLRERTLERNLRFDTPKGDLASRFQILRLRRDDKNLLTYKAPGNSGDRMERVEIEVEVSDFAQAQALVEALGYQVSFVYEKYRTNYGLRNAHISLDETPLGVFVEIEAPDGAAVRATASLLELDWERRITDSYSDLFNLASFNLGLEFRDMTFGNFESLALQPQAMGIAPAD
jgi:adenylate cyclase class 2